MNFCQNMPKWKEVQKMYKHHSWETKVDSKDEFAFSTLTDFHWPAVCPSPVSDTIMAGTWKQTRRRENKKKEVERKRKEEQVTSFKETLQPRFFQHERIWGLRQNPTGSYNNSMKCRFWCISFWKADGIDGKASSALQSFSDVWKVIQAREGKVGQLG